MGVTEKFSKKEVGSPGSHPSLNLRIGSDLKQTSLIDVWFDVWSRKPIRNQEWQLLSNQMTRSVCERQSQMERRLIGLRVIGMRPIIMKMR